MAEQAEKKTGWRWGVNRWIILLLLIGSAYFAGRYPPVPPHIQLPPENVAGPLFNLFGQPFYLTNTLIATILADIILLLLAFGVGRAIRSGSLIPKGISGAVEGFLEVIYNLTHATAGRWTSMIFPMFATITMLVLVANWMELLPGVDSIGVFDEHHIPEEAQCNFEVLEIGGLHIESLQSGESECSSGVIPFVRVASTSLNFTLAIALIAVASVQFVGVRALGLGYFTKFFNTSTLFKVPMFGVIDFGVGLIELVSELIKILSFTFRLFGNIFAGSVMLFIIGSLVPVFAQSGFLLLEFFVGLIQALVFGLLTMIFMSQATISHHPAGEHGEEHH